MVAAWLTRAPRTVVHPARSASLQRTSLPSPARRPAQPSIASQVRSAKTGCVRPAAVRFVPQLRCVTSRKTHQPVLRTFATTPPAPTVGAAIRSTVAAALAHAKVSSVPKVKTARTVSASRAWARVVRAVAAALSPAAAAAPAAERVEMGPALAVALPTSQAFGGSRPVAADALAAVMQARIILEL